MASAAGLALAACGEPASSATTDQPERVSPEVEQPPFAAVVPPNTSIAGAPSRMRLPTEILEARRPTLVTASPADLRRAQELRDRHWNTNFQITSVSLTEVRTGGLPGFGADPIDAPRFEDLHGADAFLKPTDPVIAIAARDDVRAYPLRILLWHETVNDVVGGQPLLVTYDPRTNLAQVYERRLLGAAMRFRAADAMHLGGRLLWDSLTQSWWRQFTGEAIVGDYTGLRLRPRPSLLVSYQEFKGMFPHGRVLEPGSRPDDFDASVYGTTRYAGYEGSRDSTPYAAGVVDPRLDSTARVLALDLNSEAVAFDFSHLASQRVVNHAVGGQPVVAFWSPGALSVLDTPHIDDARDVGMAAAHGREVDGRLLTFEFIDGAYRDRETGSVWSLNGHAQSGSLAGAQLPPLVHGTPFWWAWAAHYPATRLVANPT